MHSLLNELQSTVRKESVAWIGGMLFAMQESQNVKNQKSASNFEEISFHFLKN
jgi:hypothetical protein